MIREHQWLTDHTGHQSLKPISDAQLRRLLAGLDYMAYNTFNATFFGWACGQAGVWQSVDGKELRGSIDGVGGQKRGEVMVRLVGHEDAQATIIGFYEGDKESERGIVETFLKTASDLSQQRMSLDALFLTPTIVEHLQQNEVGYVVGLKSNQAELLAQSVKEKSHNQALEEYHQLEKGHGRVESRAYEVYSLAGVDLAERWAKSGLESVVCVDRHRWQAKTGRVSQEQAWFVSNLPASCGLELVGAIRNHWQIEADHYIRDTTGGEDKIRCGCGSRLRTLASVLNVGLNLLRGYDRKGNLRACWEDCTADRDVAQRCWKKT